MPRTGDSHRALGRVAVELGRPSTWSTREVCPGGPTAVPQAASPAVGTQKTLARPCRAASALTQGCTGQGQACHPRFGPFLHPFPATAPHLPLPRPSGRLRASKRWEHVEIIRPEGRGWRQVPEPVPHSHFEVPRGEGGGKPQAGPCLAPGGGAFLPHPCQGLGCATARQATPGGSSPHTAQRRISNDAR